MAHSITRFIFLSALRDDEVEINFQFTGYVFIYVGNKFYRVRGLTWGSVTDTPSEARSKVRQLNRLFNRQIGRASVKIGRELKKAIRLAAPVRTGAGKRATRTKRLRLAQGLYRLDYVLQDRDKHFYMYILNVVPPHSGWINRAVDPRKRVFTRIMRNEIRAEFR